MNRLTVKSYAKINLTLEVLGKRTDGYHQIASVVQAINLHDRLVFVVDNNVTVECSNPNLASDHNLSFIAADRLKQATGCNKGVNIQIQKHIPIASGLGGGSSNAATTLIALNQLWGLRLNADELLPIATSIGSDVPFFLCGGTSTVRGRGELVKLMPHIRLQWFVILSPPCTIANKTARTYSLLNPTHYTEGLHTRDMEARIRAAKTIPPDFISNTFDQIAIDAFPDLSEYWDVFSSISPNNIHIVGSGPSLFTHVAAREDGEGIAHTLKNKYGWDARLTSTWKPEMDLP